MTLPSSAVARRTPDIARVGRRGVARWRTLIALALAAVVGFPATAAIGATDAPAASSSLSVAVAPGGNGVITAPVFSVTFSVSNSGDAPAPGGPVSIALTRTALATSADVSAWLSSNTRAETEVANTTVTTVAARGTSTAAAAVDLAAVGAASLAPGAYPLSAAFSSAQGDLVAHTVIVVPDAAASTGGVGVVVPITAPPTTTGLLTVDDLKTLTASDGALRTQLNAVTGTSAILAVDPAIPAAIRVLGTAAPASAQQWLADLLALPNTRFALQFGDADLATSVAAGAGAPVSVPSLDSYMSARNFPSTPAASGAAPTSSISDSGSATPTGAATPTPSGRTLPTLAELLDIGTARANVFWPATGSATAALVTALSTANSDGAQPVTLIASSAVSAGSGGHADAAGAGLLVYDDGASAALRSASLASDSVRQGASIAAASAYASFATRAAGANSPLLVVIDRASGRSATGLRTAIAAASTLSGRSAVDLDALLAAPAAAVTVTGGSAPDDGRVSAVQGLLDDESRLSSFATMLADPTVLTAPERAGILQLLGNVWLGAPDQFATAVSDHHDATTKTLDAVAIVPPSDITLLASSAPLTFSVRNDLPWPVTLTLNASPNDPRLIIQKSTAVSARAEQSTRVQVPVQARVGSGESTLELQLRSSTGAAIGPDVRVAVTVRAEWESIGIVLMSVLIGAMLVFGVIRTVRRLRRRSRARAETHEDPNAAPRGEEDADG
ncbi:2-oxoglutarate dehydrogenase [Microbacterium sp. VKM Ac-2870]|uniref:DUF6049 family protein n=1 Tax=Microbacterium sp. VKM Ac-2870 TaxID=2783825 RepID=UPI00188DA8F8|nr:DUF6049 family protein [Microbacterium sp. VKM Ac-2870]MBF4562578.1 2-oxoglutarate dehydrogenase [Microbacterium sp. VKM Ac-2870]